jgi:hypothetical protein
MGAGSLEHVHVSVKTSSRWSIFGAGYVSNGFVLPAPKIDNGVGGVNTSNGSGDAEGDADSDADGGVVILVTAN